MAPTTCQQTKQVIINELKYFVKHIIEHQEYNRDNLNHDIALLKLDRPVIGVTPTKHLHRPG